MALGSNDVGQEQKGAWERELLGVNLSHNPVMALASMDTADAIKSMDQLGDDIQGKPLQGIGYASNITERSTKEGKRFLIVGLELMGGQLETLVWPDTLQRTSEVWQEGRLLLVSGKIRDSGGQPSLVCDGAEEYSADSVVRQDASTRNGNGNGHETHYAPSPDLRAAINGNGGRGRRGWFPLGVTESDDPSRDAWLLREVIGVILEYPGRDRVN